MAAARKRGRGAIVGVAALLLLAALVVGAELVARQVVPGMVRDAVVERLALPADHPVDVDIDGILLPQLIAGTLADVRIASRDVTVGAFSGDVVARGEAVPIRGDAPAAGGAAEVRMTTEQLRSLLSGIDGFPAGSVELAAPNVAASFEAEVLGASIPLGIALEPSASDGDIVLTPVEGTIAEATVRADELRQRFGAALDGLLQDRRVCIASSVPAGATLTSIEVDGDELVARFDIAGGIVADPALQEPGTCA
ncbi:LmeA family phospholipid-binding protein [Agrococcus lahaulensis]|uniref:LmeA family phospholipid-binding protein n=1 Tax=Agrococcus lahaulensis TaxID=341722 RepID=UPI0005536551|nr:LmeA family phospholipid-binding protein [Agrococcus lahaulensis]